MSFLSQLICSRISAFCSAVASCVYFLSTFIASPPSFFCCGCVCFQCCVSPVSSLVCCLSCAKRPGTRQFFLVLFLQTSCLSSLIFHARNLGCGLLFSLSFAWDLFLECFRFERCGALGHVVTSAFSLCGVVACVFLLFLPCLGEIGVDIYVFA